MTQNRIAFPGLSIGPFTITEGFKIGPLSVRWYGVIIACGILLAYLFAVKKGRKRGITSDNLLDVVLWGLPSALICARLYYVIFSWSYYREHLGEIFKIWEGGIAIYGAVIGALISTVIYARVKKLSAKKLVDIGAFGLLIGQIVGRWGNFVNAEAYGGETATALFRMELLDLHITVHPTFLYESFWNFLVFLGLNLWEKHQKFDGEIFLLYLSGYGLGRFFIEGMRTDSLYLGSLRVSQGLALVCFLTGLILWLIGRKKAKKAIP